MLAVCKAYCLSWGGPGFFLLGPDQAALDSPPTTVSPGSQLNMLIFRKL